MNDKGHWTARGMSKDSSGKATFVCIESDDFEHDVLLEVMGDFASVEDKLAYAQNLADRLNAAFPENDEVMAAMRAQDPGWNAYGKERFEAVRLALRCAREMMKPSACNDGLGPYFWRER